MKAVTMHKQTKNNITIIEVWINYVLFILDNHISITAMFVFSNSLIR